jgi:hypothetical protein
MIMERKFGCDCLQHTQTSFKLLDIPPFHSRFSSRLGIDTLTINLEAAGAGRLETVTLKLPSPTGDTS